MIKFFRKIRQRLLSKNPPAGRAGKFSKYLIYATGEIVLVVIGILIALQINNWNEERRIRKDELSALVNLQNEFKNNRERLLISLNFNLERENAWKDFLLSIKDYNYSETENRILWRGAPGHTTTNLTNSSLNAILASRDIDKIENDSLKILLLQWNDTWEDYREEETNHSNFVISKLEGFEDKNIPIRISGPWDQIKFYKELSTEKAFAQSLANAYRDIEYKNLLLRNHKWLVVKTIEGSEMENKLNRIIDLLDKEIKSKINK